MPNFLAYGMLLLWPLVALGLFLGMPARRAIVWSLLGGYLLLPVSVGFDLPGVPPLNKDSIPCIATFVLALLLVPKGRFKWPRSPVVNLLMLLFVTTPIITGLNNSDPLVLGNSLRPGMTLYDSISFGATNAIMLMPFVLGAGILRDEQSHRELLRIFTIAGLAYSLPILWEIRFSPQLATQIYNVGIGEYFVQQLRSGGFRSTVFLGHGLLVSTFCAMAFIAALGLWRTKQRIAGLPIWLPAIYLGFILVLNKSMGALLLAICLGPLFFVLKPKRFALVALVIGIILVSYPALRGAGLIPTHRVLDASASVSAERANSLRVRLENEDMLLNRAAERLWFGWGSYSRNRIIVLTSWGGAADVSITDGTWIIVVGSYGWVGYFVEFGLLCYPFWQCFKLRRRGLTVATSAMAAMHLLNLIDLIPNSSLRPITWLIAGALSGALTVAQARSAKRGRIAIKPQRINATVSA